MLIVWVIFSFACGANSKQKKSYFEKIQFDCDYINSGKDRYYRIIQNKDSKERTFADICLYQFDFSLSTEKEKLAMIKELLLFKGDTDNCSIMVKGYNIQSSQIIPDYFKTYSIQVEALFIINHIIFGNPYNYSPYPVLKKVRILHRQKNNWSWQLRLINYTSNGLITLLEPGLTKQLIPEFIP